MHWYVHCVEGLIEQHTPTPTLQGAAAQQGEASLLLDVGAGHGLASGAAAARGHAVVAVEPCSAMRGALQATARQQEMRSQLAVVEGECVGLSADVCLCGNGVLRSTVRWIDIHTHDICALLKEC